MTERTCPSCGQRQPDGLLCKKCTEWLRNDLQELPGLMRNLRLTYSRQSRHGNSGGRRTKASEGPLPWNNKAAKVHDEAVNMIGTWIRALEIGDLEWRIDGCSCMPYRACRGYRMHYLRPNMTAWCRWLLARINRVRGHEGVAEFALDVKDVIKKIRRAIDLPPDRVFAGQCDVCGGELYAKKGAAEVACRKCAEVAGPDDGVPIYDVEDRRKWLQETVRSRLATAQEILAAVPSLYGVEINSNTFKSWVTRGRLEARGVRDGQALYSIDAVLSLATRAAVAQATRSTSGHVA